MIASRLENTLTPDSINFEYWSKSQMIQMNNYFLRPIWSLRLLGNNKFPSKQCNPSWSSSAWGSSAWGSASSAANDSRLLGTPDACWEHVLCYSMISCNHLSSVFCMRKWGTARREGEWGSRCYLPEADTHLLVLARPPAAASLVAPKCAHCHLLSRRLTACQHRKPVTPWMLNGKWGKSGNP